ncbi:hypothetical protein [Neorhodopirellula pilleata]|uniref:Uncharacterized protein n=1 Tax=Neorhodopirellula pilleata TaxID=2714738 RepID=A0A5C6A4V3_9BACT|nr:hypothetical protein [Neorhodopirellula pilleata]TWT94944.1 hypothetical protein Pla100_35230 [Neorhodopirellula pilleata]
MIQRFHLAAILFFLCCCLNGCGDSNGVVATEDEMKAYVEVNGDQALDPAAQTEIAE